MSNFKRHTSSAHRFKRLFQSRRTWWAIALVVAAFGLANIAVFASHHNRTYSNTTLGGQKLGTVSSDELTSRLKQMALLPPTVRFEQGTTAATVDVSQLGISIDYEATIDRLMAQRSKLPLANLWSKHSIAVALTSDDSKLNSVLDGPQLQAFNKNPTDARIEPKGGSFIIVPETNGANINRSATRQALLEALGTGHRQTTVTTTQIQPKISSNSLAQDLQKLSQQTTTGITFSYNGKSKRLSGADITGLYAQSGSSMAISDNAILTTVAAAGSSWDIVVQDQSQVVAAVRKALEQQKDTTITLVAAPVAAKTIYYCSSVRGVSESELPSLNNKLQSTLADSRGWNLGGLVRFIKSDAGCQMHFWLTAADQMPSFGAICDSSWSCAVHPNVVINYDRWRYASEAWNAQKGSLEDYRSMVINHESGHWFGFYHADCPGPGQAAPVMQQQSINLQGCSFNPWPTSSEQASLKKTLGV